MRPLPIRLRLTVWYSVMFAIGALLLSSTSWWMLRHTIDATVHQDLQERVDDVRMQLHQLKPQLNPAEARAQFEAIYHLRDDGKWLQILDQNGQWIYRSSRMALLDTPLSPSNSLHAPNNTFEFNQGTRHVRALSTSILVDGRTYAIETGVSINKQDILLRHFGFGLLLLTPGVLIASIATGNVLSGKALSPVAQIANEARRISDRNLDQRLPVPHADDELSHLAITLNNMLARIDAGFRSVRDFTANASHELRTPLARLHTEIDIALLCPRSADEYRDTLEHLQIVAVDTTRLVESLLSLARAEAGSDVLRLAPVDLGTLVEAIMEEWAPVAARCSLELRVISYIRESDEPLSILGDRLALLRLLRIWLDNACKFTPAGGRISIITERVGETVLIAVEDSGIGIAADQQDRVFERFYRSQGDTSQQKTGVGLGLSLATWIAEQHGTVITLKSAPGSGSHFQVALVRIPDQSRATTQETASPQKSLAEA